MTDSGAWRFCRVCLVGCLFLGVNGTPPRAEDWPQWRGPRRDGTLREAGYAVHFPPGGLRRLWEVPVQGGYSAPSVAGGRVVVTDRPGREHRERVLCYDAETGKLLWEHSYEVRFVDIQYDNGPRAAPTIHDGLVVVFGTMGHLHCLRLEDGQVVWKKALQQDYGTQVPIWGMAGAPLVYEQSVIVPVGGPDGACVVAFEQDTGKERWRALDDDVGYSSPILVDAPGKPVLVFWSADAVVGLDPETGRVFWRVPFPVRQDLAVATPVVHGDFLFISSFYDGSLLLRLSPDRRQVTQVWHVKGRSERNTESLHCLISTPRMDGDYIYGVDSYGQLRCLRRRDGSRVWETIVPTGKERWSNAHLVSYGAYTYLFNEHGELIVAELKPEGYREISRTRVLEPTQGVPYLRPVTWAHPAFANRRLYVRNDRRLVCYNLQDEQADRAAADKP
jgi:outer membrane protein assembly factor BamB